MLEKKKRKNVNHMNPLKGRPKKTSAQIRKKLTHPPPCLRWANPLPMTAGVLYGQPLTIKADPQSPQQISHRFLYVKKSLSYICKQMLHFQQKILQACHGSKLFQDEIYLQLIKQTAIYTTQLTTEKQMCEQQHVITCPHYWHLIACMSSAYHPSRPILNYLKFHLKR